MFRLVRGDSAMFEQPVNARGIHLSGRSNVRAVVPMLLAIPQQQQPAKRVARSNQRLTQPCCTPPTAFHRVGRR